MSLPARWGCSVVGEANNQVALAKAEWNALVDAILEKKLIKL